MASVAVVHYACRALRTGRRITVLGTLNKWRAVWLRLVLRPLVPALAGGEAG